MTPVAPGFEFTLKTMHREAVPEALRKAEVYRLLNEPSQAESILLDVLEVDPTNQKALVTLILAMSDHFGDGSGTRSVRLAGQYIDQLTDPYQQAYYRGIVHEREARAFLGKGPASVFAYDGLRHAMEHFEAAGLLSAPGNDDAILRWNSCVRTIRGRGLRPRPDEGELPLE